MNMQIKKLPLILIALTLMVSLHSFVTAQNRRWHEIKGKPLVEFDWNCATPSAYPRAKLDRVVRAALKKDYAGVKTWADRAFVFDLNGDRKPEYFVPLVCGATGNCTWGIFSPAKLIGIVNGQYIYVHQRVGRWPDMVTYAHMSSAEGILSTYSFRRTQYIWLGDEYPTDVRGGIYGNKLPKFLGKARVACKSLGY